jgi:uncharacterized phage protein (TIGR02218 family)
MKPWPAQLITDIGLKVTSIAFIWTVTRPDQVAFGFTNHQKNIPHNGLIYKAATGFTATEVSTRAGLNVDNLDVEGALDAASITNADLVAGLWDFSEVEVAIINWKFPGHGVGNVRRGWLGEVRRSRSTFVAELRGMMQKLQQRTGREVTPACPWELGDARCGIDLDTFPDGRVTTTVDSVVSQREFTAAGLTQPAGWFDDGSIVFNDGQNIGPLRLREIKTHATGGVITLQMPTPYPIAPGDSFTATVGDLKTRDVCRDKFHNVVNPVSGGFGGFLDVPGIDSIVAGL